MWEVYYKDGTLYKTVASFQKACDILSSDIKFGYIKRKWEEK